MSAPSDFGRPPSAGGRPPAGDLVLTGPIRQVAYVVPQLDVAIAEWLAVGVGPWFVLRGIKSRNVYRGRLCDVTFSVAFSNSGDLQLEIIQPDDEQPSAFREFLDAGNSGFHHLAWWVDDYEAALRRAADAGWTAVFSDAGLAARYTYFHVEGAPATALEAVEINDSNRGLFDLIRDESARWRPGQREVRNLPAGLLGSARPAGSKRPPRG